MPSIRPLRLVVTVLTTLVAGAFALSAWRDHTLSRQEAERDLSEIAHLMEEHSRAALLAGDLQISRIQDAMGKRLPQQMSGTDHATLARLTATLPFFDSAWIFDADANIRATSYDLPTGGVNVSDRPYYAALRDGADNFISPLFWGRLRPQPFVGLSRRLEGRDGHFAGGILVTLKASYFNDFYRDLSLQPGAVFAIYKDDGNLVMRSSLQPEQENLRMPDTLLGEMLKAPTGIVATVSVQDGVERLYAYRRLNGHPLIVSAGLPMHTIFAGWRERTLRNGIIAAFVLAAFLTIAAKLAETLRREAGLRVRAEALLAEKNMLFQEIHHRVKNNLQIIASFLTMQAVHTPEPAVTAAFEEALSRLQSMSLIHQILYEQNEASEVSMDCYLRALGDSIGQTFGAAPRGIHIAVAAAETKLALDQAVPLALLANEALTNALKHAFPGDQGGTIHMELARRDDVLAFSLVDDGIGMPENARNGLGMTILAALARQLDGTLAWATGPGTRLTVTFPA